MTKKTIEVKDLLEAGVHFGHLTRKWNPNMAPYIYMERNGIHVINLYKTAAKLEEANKALQKIASSGRKILFVATKKQAKDIVAKKALSINMPYITERWPGGMLTNFVTIRKAVKKMASIDRMKKDGTFDTLSKKEKLQIDRSRAKLEKNLGSISDMTRLPGALFIVDTMREHIAVREAQKLNIPIFAMVDTNSDPREIDYVIPSNDDASKSIESILSYVTTAIAEGLAERKAGKDDEAKDSLKTAKAEAPKAKEAKVEEEVQEVKTEAPEKAAEAETKEATIAKEAVEKATAPEAEDAQSSETVEEVKEEETAEAVVEEVAEESAEAEAPETTVETVEETPEAEAPAPEAEEVKEESKAETEESKEAAAEKEEDSKDAEDEKAEEPKEEK